MATSADLLTALKTQWTAGVAAGTISSSIVGPYRDREPAKETPVYPYCVVTIAPDPRLDHQTNQSEFWLINVEIAIYDNTDAKSEGYIDGIGAYFDHRLPSLAAGKGSVLRVRRLGESYGREGRGVHKAVLKYEYLRQKPRVAAA